MHDLQSTRPVASAEAAGESFVHTRAFEWLSRAGFVARALVYGIIGVLALKLAIGYGGKLTSQQGALHTVAKQPFGKVLLTLVAIGLGGYSLWRLVRVAALGSGIAYAVICGVAIEILLGAGGGHGGTKKPTAGVLGWPGGTWIVGIAGGVMIGVALYQGYRGITKKFLDDSKVGEMSPTMKVWIGRLGTFGHLARMVVFGLIGVFLVKAAVDYMVARSK